MPSNKINQTSKCYQFLLIVLSTLYFPSCYVNQYYAPNGHHLLRLQNKNEVKAESAFYRGAFSNGFSAQAGYSPLKNIGIQANYFRSNSAYKNTLQMQEANLGVGGYFFNSFLDSLNTKNYAYAPGFLFDAYVGMGVGTNRNRYNNFRSFNSTSLGYLELNYNKYYLQLGLHYQSFRAVALSYTTRFLYLDYNKASVIGNVGDRRFDDLERLQEINPAFLRENTFTTSIGGDKLNYYISFRPPSPSQLSCYGFEDHLQVGMGVDGFGIIH